MRLLAHLALAAALASAGAAVAGPADVNPESRYTGAYKACLAAPSGESTLGMMQCTQAETTRQDGRLNAAYRKAMDGLNARQKARLVAAQRAWIVFRDAECASFYDEDWGTIAKVNVAVCLLDTTIRRTASLEHYPPET